MAKKPDPKKLRKHTTFRLPVDLDKELDKLAKKLERSKSQIIIMSIRSFLSNDN